MTSAALQQHHDIAMLAAMAARDRCNGYGESMSVSAGMAQTTGLAPAAAGKAVTDAYVAALASLNQAPVKSPSKTARSRK